MIYCIRNGQIFPQWLYHFALPTAKYDGITLHSHQHLVLSITKSQFSVCACHYSFNLHFPNDWWCWASLLVLFVSHVFSFFNLFSCAGSSLLCTGVLWSWWVGTTPRCGAWASRCGGFSCCRAQAIGTQASAVGAPRPSSCGSCAELLHGMWNLPGPGIKPVSPELTGQFLSTVPPGKSSAVYFLLKCLFKSFPYFFSFFFIFYIYF